MDMVKSMLKEELEHSLEVRGYYAAELEKLPRGSLVRKKIHGREYFYVVRREGVKVKTDYVGTSSDGRAAQLSEEINRRRHYEKMLKDVEQKITYLRKVLCVNAG
jgi:hypothetical protein